MNLKKILHVEDDEDIQAVALMSLEALGNFDVLQCLSGQEALGKAPAFRPDLFLLDAMMPGMSGLETLTALRLIPDMKNIPVIFMTAKAQQDEVQNFMNHGAIGVITKPFDPVTLSDEIRTIWQQKAALPA